MARKDPKGRVLRRGESYRPDKKLYIYQYRDPFGQTHTLYASNIMDLRKKSSGDMSSPERVNNRIFFSSFREGAKHPPKPRRPAFFEIFRRITAEPGVDHTVS